jgi:myosin heavy subunit
MSVVNIHVPQDRVYVRDAPYAWLPAVVEEVNVDRILVRIELPNQWNKTTIPSKDGVENDSFHHQKRWIKLDDYCNHRLPFQNPRICRDMAELEHIHEAEILYQIKERHCVNEMPYTRVGDIIVATNPCRWIHSLYSVSKQHFYFEHFAQSPVSRGE